MKQAIPLALVQRYAFSRGLVPGIDASCTQAIAHALLVWLARQSESNAKIENRAETAALPDADSEKR